MRPQIQHFIGKSLDQSRMVRRSNGTALVMSMIVKKTQVQRNTCPYCYKTDLGVDGSHTGEDYCCLVFLLLNLSDNSCEKQFRIKNGIIEYRNIFILLSRKVRQLFELVA